MEKRKNIFQTRQKKVYTREDGRMLLLREQWEYTFNLYIPQKNTNTTYKTLNTNKTLSCWNHRERNIFSAPPYPCLHLTMSGGMEHLTFLEKGRKKQQTTRSIFLLPNNISHAGTNNKWFLLLVNCCLQFFWYV